MCNYRYNVTMKRLGYYKTQRGLGKAGPINGLHAMFSIGAFIFPILLMFLTKSNAENWVLACGFMIIMGILSWLLFFNIPIDDSLEAKKEIKGGGNGFFREPLFYLTILILFFYLCAEQGVIGWLVTYFKDTGLLDPSLAQLMASIQWIMILAGRLTTAWVSTKVGKEKILPVMGLGLVVFYLLLVNSHSTGLIVLGIMGFPFIADKLAEGKFVRSDASFGFPYGFKHGTILKITQSDYEKIKSFDWSEPEDLR